MPDEDTKTSNSSLRLNKACFSPRKLLKAFDAKSAKSLRKDIVAQLGAVKATGILTDLQNETAALDFLVAAFSLSSFLRDQALIHPQEFATLLSRDF